MTVPRIGAALVLAAAAAFTTACSGTPTAGSTTGATASAGVPSSPVPSSATPGAIADAEPTCETIIAESTVKDFADLGWTVQEDPFMMGETQLPGGLQCTWGDPSRPGDHAQLFGWAPITDEQANAARSELLASGWREVDEDGSLYITENADTVIDHDDEGYGLTYLLGDGWVKYADTKQSLLLVEWPQD